MKHRLVLYAGLILAAPLAAQQEPAAPAAPPQEPVELVFEREMFAYPTFERRSPFRSLVGDTDAGPRFEQVRLRGIIWSTDPARSVALFSEGGGTGQQGPPVALSAEPLRTVVTAPGASAPGAAARQGRRKGWGIRRGNAGTTLNDTERQRALTGRTVRGEFQPLRAGSEPGRSRP